MDFNFVGLSSVYRTPAVRDIHPANIPAVSPTSIPPVTHPMALEFVYDRSGRVIQKLPEISTISILA